MLRWLCIVPVLAALGCSRDAQPAEPEPVAEPRAGEALRLDSRRSLEVGEMSGFSSLARDSQELLWSVPEKGRVLVQLRIDGENMSLRALNDNYPEMPLPGGLNDIKGVVIQQAGKRRKDRKFYDR